MPRKICIMTGSRADYGLFYWLMSEIAADPEFELQVLVTGAHLAPGFGLTWREIEADGFPLSARVEMLLTADTPTGIVKSTGLGMIGMADALDRLKPDILVLLGDRFETLAAAQTALMMRIPIAHLHGGELTEGAFDDAIRHAITKMASWHFVAAADFGRRIAQMGEDPARIFVTGAPGIDHVLRTPLLDRAQLSAELDFDLSGPFFLVTYHPVTLGNVEPETAITELTAALSTFPQVKAVVTGVNADTGNSRISRLFEDFAAARPGDVLMRKSLGQRRYVSAMRHAAAVVGNSSSGMIEAPAVATPTVNVGDRQRGRLQAPSVLSCPDQRQAIVAALSKAQDPAFRAAIAGQASPYGDGTTAPRMKAILKRLAISSDMKVFHDLPLPDSVSAKFGSADA